MDLSGADLDAVTRTILGEAGPNATHASMAAVASVIRNRLQAGGYGKTPSEIVHAPYQFEAWHPPGGTGPALTASPSDASYKQAQALAQGVFTGVVADQTNGATHFYAPAAQAQLGRSTPKWAQGTPLAEIGGHVFFAPGGGATPGNAPGGPETTTPYSGPGSTPTPQTLPPLVPPVGQTQLAQGGGGLLGNLLFGRQGIMGLLPQPIQQKGIIGSALGGLGSALNGGQTPGGGMPQAPQQMAQAPAAAAPVQQPAAAASPAPGVIPGQTDPHKPGFDASSVPYLGKTADAGGSGLLAQLFGGGAPANA